MNQLEYDTFVLHKDDYLIWRDGRSVVSGNYVGAHTFTYRQQGNKKLRCPHGHITPYCFKSFYVHEAYGTLYVRDVKKTKPNYDTTDIDSPKISNWV